MCNLYAFMKACAEVAALARAMTDLNNNQPPMPGIYPDYAAPIITHGEDGPSIINRSGQVVEFSDLSGSNTNWRRHPCRQKEIRLTR